MYEMIETWLVSLNIQNIDFRGHALFPLGLSYDTFLAFLPLGILGLLLITQSKKKKGLSVGLFALWVLFVPNASYLILEPKHLFLQDGVTDSFMANLRLGIVDWEAVVVLGLFSLAGVIALLLNILIAANKLSFAKERKKTFIVAMCILTAVGTAIGFTRISTLQGILEPTTVIIALKTIASSPFLAKLVVYLSVGQIVVTLLANNFWEKIWR